MGWNCLSNETPVARKSHQCFLCFGTIELGERHVKRSGVADGSFVTSRFHIECEAQTKDWDEMDWESCTAGSLPRPDAG